MGFVPKTRHQDMFENGKPDIVLKPVKRFNIKKNFYYNFDYKKSLKLGIVVLVMFNKMLVIVYFTLDMGRDPKNHAFQFVPISDTHC